MIDFSTSKFKVEYLYLIHILGNGDFNGTYSVFDIDGKLYIAKQGQYYDFKTAYEILSKFVEEIDHINFESVIIGKYSPLSEEGIKTIKSIMERITDDDEFCDEDPFGEWYANAKDDVVQFHNFFARYKKNQIIEIETPYVQVEQIEKQDNKDTLISIIDRAAQKDADWKRTLIQGVASCMRTEMREKLNLNLKDSCFEEMIKEQSRRLAAYLSDDNANIKMAAADMMDYLEEIQSNGTDIYCVPFFLIWETWKRGDIACEYGFDSRGEGYSDLDLDVIEDLIPKDTDIEEWLKFENIIRKLYFSFGKVLLG